MGYEELWKLALAYNSTPQESTGCHPFTLMFAQRATIPNGAESKLTGAEVEEILGKDEEKRHNRLATDLVRRAALLAVTHIHAGLNLHIAQHRDYHKYMNLYDMGHPARRTGYKPGAFVMVWQKPRNKIEAKAKPVILQVVDTLDSGIVLLRGADGVTIKSQASHLAPCPVKVHPMVDVRDRTIPASLACRVCGSKARAASMLVCDHCNQGYHMSCLQPPLKEVPEGDWYCPNCSRKRSAPTAQDIFDQNVSTHQQETPLTAVDDGSGSMLCMVLLACKQQGVRMTAALGEQLILECDPAQEQELHSVRSPTELEKEQRALIIRFIKECDPARKRDVHATSNPNVLKEWLWIMLRYHQLPDAREHEVTRMWLVDVDSVNLSMLFSILIDSSGVTPFAVAMKLQQVTRETKSPGLDVAGQLWLPALRAWKWQGRLRIIGLPPMSWLVLTSDAWTLTHLFTS